MTQNPGFSFQRGNDHEVANGFSGKGAALKGSYRPDEAAALLGLTRRTIYRLIAKNKLPAVGSPARILRQDLEKFFKKK